MKRIIGIIMMVVMLVCCFTANAEPIDELMDFIGDNNRILSRFVGPEPYGTSGNYNIMCDCVYAIAIIEWTSCDFEDKYDFMNRYPEYLAEHWPEFAKDVKIEYTYTGRTEHYEIICTWLTLENGRTFNEYVNGEPELSKMAALCCCARK